MKSLKLTRTYLKEWFTIQVFRNKGIICLLWTVMAKRLQLVHFHDCAVDGVISRTKFV